MSPLTVRRYAFKWPELRPLTFTRSGNSSVGLEPAPESWSKGCGFESRRERQENFLLKGRSIYRADSLFRRYLEHPRVNAIAREISRSFCQKCRWHVTAKTDSHSAPYECAFCMKWHGMMHGCMVYTERAERAAVSRGTSHVTSKQRRCKYTTSAGIPNAPYKASHSFTENHVPRQECTGSAQ